MSGTRSMGWRWGLLIAFAAVGLGACSRDGETRRDPHERPGATVVAGLPPRPGNEVTAPAAGASAGVLVIDPANVRLQSGHAFWVALPEAWLPYASSLDDPQRSTLILHEDGRPLGPGNAPVATVQTTGRGSFVHWGGWLYFSTSDNTDPRSNGREYRLVLAAVE
jgi:hypothetical protein